MTRTVGELLNKDLLNITDAIKNCFEITGSALSTAVRPDIGNTILGNSSLIGSSITQMSISLEKDLQDRNGPVAKRLKEQNRLQKAFTKCTSPVSLIIGNNSRSPYEDMIDVLSPNTFDNTPDALFTILSKYFPLSNYNRKTNTLCITHPNMYRQCYSDGTLKPSEFKTDREILTLKRATFSSENSPSYEIVFNETQDSGSIVETKISISPSSGTGESSHWISVNVIHDQLEDVTYTGAPRMFNLSRFSETVVMLMENAGFLNEIQQDVFSRTLNIQKEIESIFRELPLPKEITSFDGCSYLSKPTYSLETYWVNERRYWKLMFHSMNNEIGAISITGLDNDIGCIGCHVNGIGNVSGNFVMYHDDGTLRFQFTNYNQEKLDIILDKSICSAFVKTLRQSQSQLIQNIS